MNPLVLRDRARGMMLGLACGDALGAQVEFMRRGSFPRQTEMTGGGPHRLEPGQWTDDTAMALHLGRHLLTDPNVLDPAALARRWIGWWRKGEGSCTGTCFDVGTQTSAALGAWERAGEFAEKDAGRCGNGALMRVAPVVLTHATLSGAKGAAHRQALVTHPAPCADLCQRYVTILWDLLRAESTVDELNYLLGGYANLARRPELLVRSGGYHRDTFGAALWSLLSSDNPEEAVVRAVNLGDDADTVGAVTGALAGAAWGASALPARWLDKLAWAEEIADLADRLLDGRA